MLARGSYQGSVEEAIGCGVACHPQPHQVTAQLPGVYKGIQE